MKAEPIQTHRDQSLRGGSRSLEAGAFEGRPSSREEPRKRIGFLEVWRKVVFRYPQMKKEQARLAEALAEKALACSGYIPRLGARVGAVGSNDPVEVFMMKLKEREFSAGDFDIHSLNYPGTRFNGFGALRVELPIFDALQTAQAVESARELVRSAQWQVRWARMEASLVAINAYLELLAAEELEKVADEALALAQKDVKEAWELKEKGLILGADYYAAQSLLASLEAEKNHQNARRRAASAVLATLQGEPASFDLGAQGKLQEGRPESRTLSQWLQDACVYRADLAALSAMTAARKAEVERQKATLLPRISGFTETETDSNRVDRFAGSYTVGILGTIDLWDPSRGPRIRKAEATLEESRQEEKRLKDSIQESVSQTYAEYQSALRDLSNWQKAVANAAIASDLTQTLYHEGKKTVADVVQMRLQKEQAEAALRENL
ncbi:TolC family protein, partial [Candidatus Methylacidithermus pantelleriae]|uniref:TolC family protein n=1 Tax=Candidatus Methylacidithermus pantelleriae TaxID=2744239 RepID=UPI00157C2FBE